MPRRRPHRSSTSTLGGDHDGQGREARPVIGRWREIETTIEILARRKKNNPVLIGEPGVGKTAIVEGLAQAITNGDVPEVLRDKRLVELNVNSLVAGSRYRGEFEERIKQVLDEIVAPRTRSSFSSMNCTPLWVPGRVARVAWMPPMCSSRPSLAVSCI